MTIETLPPLDVYYVCVGSCNLSCSFCWYETGAIEYRRRGLSTGDFLSWLASLRDVFNVDTVALTGGEPLLRRDLLELVGGVCQLGARTIVMTNGTLVTAAMAQAFADNGVEVHVSMDDIDGGVHEAVRGQHARTIAGMHLLEEAACERRRLVMTVGRDNIDAMERTMDYAERHGWALSIQPLAVPPGDPASLASAPPHLRRRFLETLERWARREDKLPYAGLVASAVRRGAPVPVSDCAFVRRSVVVDNDGSIRPCFQKSIVLTHVSDGALRLRTKRELFFAGAVPGQCIKMDCLGVFC